MKVPVLDMDQALMKPPHMSKVRIRFYLIRMLCRRDACDTSDIHYFDDRQDEVRPAVQLCIAEAEGDRDNLSLSKTLQMTQIYYTYWAADSFYQ